MSTTTTTTFNYDVQSELTDFQNDVFTPGYFGDPANKLLGIMRSVKKVYGIAYETVPFDTIKSLINETLEKSKKVLNDHYEDALKKSDISQVGVTHVLTNYIYKLDKATNHQEYIQALADMRSEDTMYASFKYVNSKNTFLKHFADIEAKKLADAIRLAEAKKLEDIKKLAENAKVLEGKNEELVKEKDQLVHKLAQQEETIVKLQQQLDSLKNSLANIVGSVKSTQ